MLNTVYEKPKMEFVNVQNENKIANTCWGVTIHSREMKGHWKNTMLESVF